MGGQTWEGLARVIDRGELEKVITSWEVVGKGRREDLRAVCYDRCSLSEVSSVFIPEDYSRQRTRMAEARMDEEEA